MGHPIVIVHRRGLPCRYLCNSRAGYVWRKEREAAIEFKSFAEAKEAALQAAPLAHVWISVSVSERVNA